MTAPAVSVVLPTYNRAPILGRAIRSVLAQSFRDLELLVVDDGSTDETREVVGSFQDTRVHYLPQAHHGSPAVARNIGMREASAPLVAFQDSDDEWLIDKLARQLSALQAAGSGTGLICGGYIVSPVAADAHYQGADARMQAGDWSPGNILDFRFIAPTWLARRETLLAAGGFDETLPNLEDWEFAFRLFQQTRMVALDSPLLLKHGSDDGLNAVKTSRIASLQMILREHGKLWHRHPRILARLHYQLGRLQCLKGDMRAGRSNLMRAIRLHTVVPKRWLYWGASLLGHRTFVRLIRLG